MIAQKNTRKSRNTGESIFWFNMGDNIIKVLNYTSFCVENVTNLCGMPINRARFEYIID